MLISSNRVSSTWQFDLNIVISSFGIVDIKLLDEEVVRSIATQHNKSTAQVLLKWALQHGVGKCMQYACCDTLQECCLNEILLNVRKRKKIIAP